MIEALARAAQEAQDKTARFPVEPPDGTVLRYQKTFPGTSRVYTYLALKAAGKWFRTGQDSRPICWEELVEDIANNTCHVARTWGEIPKTPDSLFEGMDPDVWFEEVYGKTVTVDQDKQD